MFRELQGAVNLIPPLWTRLINSVLVPFPILASCCPRTLISPSLSPSAQKLHDKVYTIPLFTSSPTTMCPSLHVPTTGAMRSPWPQPSSCLSHLSVSVSFRVCVCLSPSISQFLSLCLCCSLSPTPSHWWFLLPGIPSPSLVYFYSLSLSLCFLFFLVKSFLP